VRIHTEGDQPDVTGLLLESAHAGVVAGAPGLTPLELCLHRPGWPENVESVGFAGASRYGVLQSALLLSPPFKLHLQFSQITSSGSLFSQLLVDKSLLAHPHA
jgi:hypothetical protein